MAIDDLQFAHFDGDGVSFCLGLIDKPPKRSDPKCYRQMIMSGWTRKLAYHTSSKLPVLPSEAADEDLTAK